MGRLKPIIIRVCRDCNKRERCKCDDVCKYCGGEFKEIDYYVWMKEKEENGR